MSAQETSQQNEAQQWAHVVIAADGSAVFRAGYGQGLLFGEMSVSVADVPVLAGLGVGAYGIAGQDLSAVDCVVARSAGVSQELVDYLVEFYEGCSRSWLEII